MSKIFVITAGEYSDYTVYGATTEPERAEEMRKIVDAHIKGHGDAQIEEYEDGIFDSECLNTIVPAEYWRVEVRTGLDEASVSRYSGDQGETVRTSSISWKGPWEKDGRGYPRREIVTQYTVSGISACDKEHAFKIAMDEIAGYRVKKGELDK